MIRLSTYVCLSRPDLRDPFMSLFWFGQGVSWRGHSMLWVLCFLFLCVCPGVVLNQRQVLVIVFDWEQYLGSLFCVGFFCGWLSSVFVCLHQTELFRFFTFVVLYFVVLNSNHAAFWSSSPSTEENRYNQGF